MKKLLCLMMALAMVFGTIAFAESAAWSANLPAGLLACFEPVS